jgi:hypothetical protein
MQVTGACSTRCADVIGVVREYEVTGDGAVDREGVGTRVTNGSITVERYRH